MTASDFRAYCDTVIRAVLVMAAITLAFYALGLSFALPDKTLFTTLATSTGLLLVGIVGYWYGAAHKVPPPADTVSTTTTETK